MNKRIRNKKAKIKAQQNGGGVKPFIPQFSQDPEYVRIITELHENKPEPEFQHFKDMYHEMALCMEMIMFPSDNIKAIIALGDHFSDLEDFLQDEFLSIQGNLDTPKSAHVIKCTLMFHKLREIFCEGAAAYKASVVDKRVVTQSELDDITGRTARRARQDKLDSFPNTVQ